MSDLETQLANSLRTLLKGFGDGVFVRNTSKDSDPSWAIRLIPFIQAMQAGQTALVLYDNLEAKNSSEVATS